MSLPPLSPYASKAIGYNLQSGQINSDLDVLITDNILKGSNKVLISNLDVEPQDEEKIKKLTTKISMPLDLALSILKNKKGDIEINIPVEGNLDNPAIDLANIVTSALAKAVRKGTLSYLKFALQPYGAAIMILEKTAKHLNEVRLNPIEFPPNSVVLDRNNRQYMNKIATMLDKSPSLRIRLCSVSTDQDLNAYEEKLNAKKSKKIYINDDILKPKEYLAELGRLRAIAIKNYLMEQHSVEANRLFICHPTVAKYEDQGRPRTEIKI